MQQGDYEAMTRCTELARSLCDESDHELLCNQAVVELERGQRDAAFALFERAHAICGGRDMKLARILAGWS